MSTKVYTMFMAIQLNKIEFDLTVRVYGEKDDPFHHYHRDKEPESELKEELKFKALSAVEVIRKLLDYITP